MKVSEMNINITAHANAEIENLKIAEIENLKMGYYNGTNFQTIEDEYNSLSFGWENGVFFATIQKDQGIYHIVGKARAQLKKYAEKNV